MVAPNVSLAHAHRQTSTFSLAASALSRHRLNHCQSHRHHGSMRRRSHRRARPQSRWIECESRWTWTRLRQQRAPLSLARCNNHYRRSLAMILSRSTWSLCWMWMRRVQTNPFVCNWHNCKIMMKPQLYWWTTGNQNVKKRWANRQVYIFYINYQKRR